MSAARLKGLAARGAEIMRETGTRGIARRAARAGLDRAADGLLDLGRHLDRMARTVALAPAARDAVLQTQALAGRESGRPAYVLGPGAERERALLSALEEVVIVAGWRDEPVPGAPPASYLVGVDPPAERAVLLEAMSRAPAATFLLPLGAFPLEEAPPRLRFFSPTVHPSRMFGTRLHAGRWPACADDLQLALAFAILLGCSPIYVVGATYDGLRTPIGAGFPPTGPLPEAWPSVLGAEPASTRYAEAVRRCNRLFEGYRYLKEEAKLGGQIVRTVDPASFLDVFPRVPASAARP